jgi:hypothetical protein
MGVRGASAVAARTSSLAPPGFVRRLSARALLPFLFVAAASAATGAGRGCAIAATTAARTTLISDAVRATVADADNTAPGNAAASAYPRLPPPVSGGVRANCCCCCPHHLPKAPPAGIQATASAAAAADRTTPPKRRIKRASRQNTRTASPLQAEHKCVGARAGLGQITILRSAAAA